MAIENDMEFSIFPSDQIIIQTPVDSEMSPDSENPIQTKVVYEELEKKVDKEEGKQLSTEDYTTAEKGKLNNLPNLQELNDNFDKKVDKVIGKGLSANDYTNEEKTKLQNLPNRGELNDFLFNIDSSAEKIANKTSILNQFSTSTQYPTAKIVYDVTNDLKNSTDLLKSKTDSLEANKVTKETGKGLSSNDYTDSAKNKVDAIPNNPKYTDTVYDDTELRNTKADKATTLEGYGITNAYTKDEIDNKISNVYEIKGSSTIANLPTNPEVGDVYNITDSGTITGTEIEVSAGDNIVYTSDGWDKLSATVDLSGYQEKLTFDSTPTEGSTNPVTSGGIKEYIIEATAEDIDNWIGNSDTTSVVGEATAGNAIVGI